MTSDDTYVLQRFIDAVFTERRSITRLDVLVRAEVLDLDSDLLEIVALLPPGAYSRQRLCDQLNAAIVGHCWAQRYRTVE